MAPHEVPGKEAFVRDSNGEGKWNLADLTGGPDLSICSSICVRYGGVRQVWKKASGAVTMSVYDLPQLQTALAVCVVQVLYKFIVL